MTLSGMLRTGYLPVCGCFLHVHHIVVLKICSYILRDPLLRQQTQRISRYVLLIELYYKALNLNVDKRSENQE